MKSNPKVFIVAMGVITILFAVFGLQQQTDAQAAREESEQLRLQLQQALTDARRSEVLAVEMTRHAEERERMAAEQLAECLKGKGKKK
ncbi:MAG: hypothetical protein JNK10_00770 [Cyclobacteriaceae bacterium]|nr:hypothetical protein [Cyclobacteriaceae bacterium]